MSRVLLINAAEPEQIRAAVIEGGLVVEYRSDSAATTGLVGNIYLGRVVNLERGIGAAFVDLGEDRNGFLHISACPGAEEGARIDERFSVGDSVMVQVTRESIGAKGPMLTGDISLPGRFVVLLPCSDGGGVSRRIGDGDGRTQLRALAKELEKRADMGLILRTAAADRTKRELVRDLRTLRRIWKSVGRRARKADAPTCLFAERDLVARALRDMVDREVTEIFVDTPEALARARDTVAAIQPELHDRLRLHEEGTPLFHAFEIEGQIDRLRGRKVPLPGGGSVVFDTTEALVAVDVNSGRTREEAGLEETALRTNLEAADEIARQLRLRDLGGVIVVDFIDLREDDNVKQVDRAFRTALAADRARLRPGRLGAFGVFALTRQRTGAGGVATRRTCPRCGGTGDVVHPEEIALRVFRELQARALGPGSDDLTARVGAEVARVLLQTRAGKLEAITAETGRRLHVEADQTVPPDGWKIEPTDKN